MKICEESILEQIAALRRDKIREQASMPKRVLHPTEDEAVQLYDETLGDNECLRREYGIEGVPTRGRKINTMRRSRVYGMTIRIDNA